MKFTGKLKGIAKDWESNKYQITLLMNESEHLSSVNDLKDALLDIRLEKHREKRSLDANAYLWSCLSDIAKALETDKWSIYLQMLKRYGKFTYIVLKQSAVESMKKQWRECEVVGDIDVGGEKAVQMLCYFGSSTYNSKEFSDLLNGVVSEMEEMGLQPPPTRELARALKELEKRQGKGEK